MDASREGPQVILASSSPRRQTFLRDMGYAFVVRVADIDETPQEDESPTQLALRLAEQKAMAVALQLPHHRDEHFLIVAADTVVAQEQLILGKPVEDREATEMLLTLRDKPHQVHSGVCVISTANWEARTRLNTTTVWMRNYSDEEIATYVATGDPLDKAGAYAIQHPDFAPANRVEGCLTGVMGLPLADLCELLDEHGLAPDDGVVTTCEQHTHFACCQRKCGFK